MHCRRQITFETMGDFWLLEQLGAGGFGKVYRAFEPRLEREVAIKVLHEKAATKDGYYRFDREARLTAQITHPNVAPVFTYGQERDQLYLVSALIKGKELKSFITNQGFADVSQAVEYGITLLETLHQVHQDYKTWHRDVKPSNIMISDTGVVYLLDFGIAASQDPDQPALTREGFPMGTPYYMPPEQVRMTKEVGPRSDQYSLAVVIYQMITGRLPFEAEQIIDVFTQILNDEPTPPSKFRPEIDPALERIILRAMSKSPARRYPTCQDFANALRTWLHGTGSTVGPNRTIIVGGDSMGGTSPTLKIFIAVVAIALLALVGYLIFKPSQETRLKNFNDEKKSSDYRKS
jgi:serine/threonine-protein kinase